MKKAILYQKLKDSQVKCLACSWYCRISNGKFGACCTRYNQNGDLYSLVYGKPTGLAVDPVEKKPFFHLLPGSNLLSFGTIGCNFGCLFCQNAWASQSNKNFPDTKDKLPQIRAVINRYSIGHSPDQIVDIALEKNVHGIAYTYNEPAVFAEFAADTAKIAKKHGLVNVFVSNGFESTETFDLIRDLIDGINIDLKSIREDFYRQVCKAKLAPVLENIRRYFEAGIVTEVTTLVIPGANDSDAELTQIADFLAGISPDIPWHISAFKPEYQMQDTPETPVSTLIKAYDIGKKAGLKFIYVGNVSDWKHSSTYCPLCNGLLIKRNWYDTGIENFDLDHGRCHKCKTKIYGKWN